jgi:hypothetical protein
MSIMIAANTVKPTAMPLVSLPSDMCRSLLICR